MNNVDKFFSIVMLVWYGVTTLKIHLNDKNY